MKPIIYFLICFLSLPFMYLHAQSVEQAVGFAGDRPNTFVLGNQESVDVWFKWCELHKSEDVEGIVALAGDNIRIEAPGGEVVIEGKENLKNFLTQWFADSEEVSVQQQWGVPVKFVNEQGTAINGDWLVTGFFLRVRANDKLTVEDNHANVYIEDGKVQYFKVFQHSISSPVDVTLSVDLSSYEGDYNTVGVFGTFNNWCGTCNTLTDEDGDGIYTATIEVLPGELEYKFILDGQSVEETFKPGDSCTKTTDIYTNRVIQIQGDVILDPVCFNSCADCD